MATDCIVCGEICVDIPVRPVDRTRPLAEVNTDHVEPILPGTGGIVPNSGMALARLGMKTQAFGCIGNDVWGDVLRRELSNASVDTSPLVVLNEVPSSATVVVGGDDGEHTFLFHAGASRRFTRDVIESRLDLFDDCQFALFGYYALMPELEGDLPDVFPQIRERDCQVALDTAGGGGTMHPLNRILQHVDIYVPNLTEGESQTGFKDPQAMITAYREFAPDALLGIKLGARGALLSPAAGEWITIEPVAPPGPIVDTTGAGDCFYAGLITGLVHGLSIPDAGRLGAAAGACSITGVGGVSALPDLDSLLSLAEVEIGT